jgi:dihydroneopterin aldolase
MFTKLTLKNMAFYGHHGVYSTEKELGQRIEVDVELVADLADAGRTDDFEATVNYVDIYTIVKDIVEKGEYNLVEAIGTAIINQISAGYDLERVTVRVRKPHPPVGGFMEAVEFEASKKGRE